jgi:hypothetical protein
MVSGREANAVDAAPSAEAVLEAIPFPGVRYESRIAKSLPQTPRLSTQRGGGDAVSLVVSLGVPAWVR